MKISVVIPYYNSPESILKALDSISLQTLLPREVIIVDDGSDPDKSIRFLEVQRDNYPFELRLIYHELNLGAPSARNNGIREAVYDYIAFLDADDCWVVTKLENQARAMGNYDLLYANYTEEMIKVDNSVNPQPAVRPVSYLDILKKNLSPVTLIAKRKGIVLFDERFRRCDDFKMSIEALVVGNKIGFLDINVSYGFKKAIGGGGLTKSLLKMSLSYLRACLFLIFEYPKLTLLILLFILFEIIKFPVRCLKVYLLS